MPARLPELSRYLEETKTRNTNILETRKNYRRDPAGWPKSHVLLLLLLVLVSRTSLEQCRYSQSGVEEQSIAAMVTDSAWCNTILSGAGRRSPGKMGPVWLLLLAHCHTS